MEPRAMENARDDSYKAIKKIRAVLDGMMAKADIVNVELDEKEKSASFSYRNISYVVKADAKEEKQFDRFFPWIVAYRSDRPLTRLEWQVHTNNPKGEEIEIRPGDRAKVCIPEHVEKLILVHIIKGLEE